MGSKPRAPAGLAKGGTGRKLWRSIAWQYELRPDEIRVLEDACREADLIEKLQEQLDDESEEFIVKGSMGQPVINPLVSELRQHRAVVQRLLSSLKLPDEGGEPAGREAHGAGVKAAAARWSPVKAASGA